MVEYSQHFTFAGRTGRVRCEKWPENGVCPDCLESMLAGQSEQEQIAILESMTQIDADPLLAWRAKQRLMDIG